MKIYVIIDTDYDYVENIKAFENIEDAVDYQYNRKIKSIESNKYASKEQKEHWLKYLNEAYHNRNLVYFDIKEVRTE